MTAAKRYTADANEHVAMAQAYGGTRITQAAVHCDRLSALSRDEAKEATAAAEMHKQLAGASRSSANLDRAAEFVGPVEV